MDPINVMEQPGYMAGMRAGQDWAAAAVRNVMKGEGYALEGSTPALQEVLSDLVHARPTIKKALMIVGLLCGMNPAAPWTGADLVSAMDRWLAKARATDQKF